MEVEVLDLTKQKNLEKKVARIARACLRAEKVKQVNLSLVLVGETRMRRLNQRWRGKKQPTDILSFSFNEANKKKDFLGVEGEIFICPGWVKKQAQRFKNDFFDELTRVVVHGILHLQGWEHERGEKQANLMLARQEKIVSQIATRRNKI